MNATCANLETCSHPSRCVQPVDADVTLGGVDLGFCDKHAEEVSFDGQSE